MLTVLTTYIHLYKPFVFKFDFVNADAIKPNSKLDDIEVTEPVEHHQRQINKPFFANHSRLKKKVKIYHGQPIEPTIVDTHPGVEPHSRVIGKVAKHASIFCFSMGVGFLLLATMVLLASLIKTLFFLRS
ncbi:hypothetical protein CDIK_0017 [Cucumispora dikerogammari]|nr:hypothetical protein CDIK_0017 [Cucumispora dikerogammari]